MPCIIVGKIAKSSVSTVIIEGIRGFNSGLWSFYDTLSLIISKYSVTAKAAPSDTPAALTFAPSQNVYEVGSISAGQ